MHIKLGIADVLDLALGVPRHLLVEEERHRASVSLAVHARDEGLPAAGRARERRGGDHGGRGRGVHVRDGHGPDAVARRTGQLSGRPAVGARRQLLHLVNFDLFSAAAAEEGRPRCVTGWRERGGERSICHVCDTCLGTIDSFETNRYQSYF